MTTPTESEVNARIALYEFCRDCFYSAAGAYALVGIVCDYFV